MITNRPGTFAPQTGFRRVATPGATNGPNGPANMAAKPLQLIEKYIGEYPVPSLVAGVAIGVALGWLVKRGT